MLRNFREKLGLFPFFSKQNASPANNEQVSNNEQSNHEQEDALLAARVLVTSEVEKFRGEVAYARCIVDVLKKAPNYTTPLDTDPYTQTVDAMQSTVADLESEVLDCQRSCGPQSALGQEAFDRMYEKAIGHQKKTQALQQDMIALVNKEDLLSRIASAHQGFNQALKALRDALANSGALQQSDKFSVLDNAIKTAETKHAQLLAEETAEFSNKSVDCLCLHYYKIYQFCQQAQKINQKIVSANLAKMERPSAPISAPVLPQPGPNEAPHSGASQPQPQLQPQPIDETDININEAPNSGASQPQPQPQSRPIVADIDLDVASSSPHPSAPTHTTSQYTASANTDPDGEIPLLRNPKKRRHFSPSSSPAPENKAEHGQSSTSPLSAPPLPLRPPVAASSARPPGPATAAEAQRSAEKAPGGLEASGFLESGEEGGAPAVPNAQPPGPATAERASTQEPPSLETDLEEDEGPTGNVEDGLTAPGIRYICDNLQRYLKRTQYIENRAALAPDYLSGEREIAKLRKGCLSMHKQLTAFEQAVSQGRADAVLNATEKAKALRTAHIVLDKLEALKGTQGKLHDSVVGPSGQVASFSDFSVRLAPPANSAQAFDLDQAIREQLGRYGIGAPPTIDETASHNAGPSTDAFTGHDQARVNLLQFGEGAAGRCRMATVQRQQGTRLVSMFYSEGAVDAERYTAIYQGQSYSLPDLRLMKWAIVQLEDFLAAMPKPGATISIKGNMDADKVEALLLYAAYLNQVEGRKATIINKTGVPVQPATDAQVFAFRNMLAANPNQAFSGPNGNGPLLAAVVNAAAALKHTTHKELKKATHERNTLLPGPLPPAAAHEPAQSHTHTHHHEAPPPLPPRP